MYKKIHRRVWELINLNQKQKIILDAYIEGKSYRSIAKEVRVHRKTVAKYVKEYEKAKNMLLEHNDNNDAAIPELIEAIIEKPKYNNQNRKKRKLTSEIIAEIEYYLKENERKRSIGQSKQQMKKIDIFEALEAKGYDISYPTICNAIRDITKEGGKAYIRAEYVWGDVCEFDWGEIKATIKEEAKTFQMSVFASAKGNYYYARLFPKQDTPCFLEAHAMFFDHIGGAYRTMVYDNMKVAVKKFVSKNEKEPTDNLLKLSIYYGFKIRFCNTYAGNEKGHVERSVEYIRRKAFGPRNEFDSLEEANDYLLEVCHRLNKKPQRLNNNQTALEILNLERKYLLPKMPMFDAARTTESRVDKYSTIVIDSCHYSVPDRLVGQMVFTKIYSNKIICYYQNGKIAEHDRKNGFYEWSIKLEHYLKTLKKKPGALASSVALHQADPRLQEIYQNHYTEKPKEFIELLSLVSEKGINEINAAIKTLKQISPVDITTEKIKVICNREVRLTSYPTKKLDCEIDQKSTDMLKAFQNLIPASQEEFKREVVVI